MLGKPHFLLPLACIYAGTAVADAQNHFPQTIPTSDIDVFIRDVAVIPDSSSNTPPRMSVLMADPAGRVFLNDQRGPLYLLTREADGTFLPNEFLDLRDYPALQLRTATGEQGFQGFAFHPDFHVENAPGYGRLYTIFSSSNTTPSPDFNPGGSTSFHTVLLEWRTGNPSATAFIPVAGEAPFREVLRFKQPFDNHNAGLVAFNPAAEPEDNDYGNLYIALGDGGSGGDPQGNGQDPSNPYGAILRIDPLGSNAANGKYGRVIENALASDNNPATLAEIFCYGLRNPQRFGWDTETGNLYIADIGQNAVEEINLGQNGGNFGWSHREGSFPFASSTTVGLIDPVAEYDHTNPVADMPTTIGNRAVTLGEVARGSSIQALNGMLLLGDFPSGLIFLLNVDTDPLNGGQAGLMELLPLNTQGQRMHLLDSINAARSARGLGNMSRADLRFSVNTPGEIFILNKHDGILRQLAAPPSIQISSQSDQIRLEFTGILQQSQTLDPGSFEIIVPQPPSPWLFTPANNLFFRTAVE